MAHAPAVPDESWPDPSLLRGLKQGNRTACREFFDRYRGRVFRYLLPRAGNREDALDMTQEVLLRVYRKAGQYDGKSPLTPWVLRIARNLRIDSYRRRNARIERGSVELEHLPPSLRVDSTTPEDELWRAEVMVRISRALLRLPRRQREMMRLRFLEQLKMEEIAAIRGVSVGTVKSTLHSASQKLRVWLADLAPSSLALVFALVFAC